MLSGLLKSGKLSVKMKLIITLTAILLSGLILSNYLNYKIFVRSLKENLISRILPMTADYIRNDVQNNPDYRINIPGPVKYGLNRERITASFKSYKESYGSTAYLVDASGIVQAHPNEKLTERADIRKLKGIKDIADVILSSKADTSIYEFTRNDEHLLLAVKFMPQFNRFLFVEIDQNTGAGTIWRIIGLNLLTGILVLSAIILFFIFIINFYQSKLEYMSVTDELTGANNRREFDLQFRKSVYNYNRNGTPFSIIIFDIDHFKSINDTMGHVTGDSSIKTVAEIARKGMRLTDILVRWGGDEFIILAQGDEDCALLAAERIRKQVETSEFFIKHNNREKNRCDITISCGVSGFKKGDTLDTILARADAALYKAKVDGRNRIYRG